MINGYKTIKSKFALAGVAQFLTKACSKEENKIDAVREIDRQLCDWMFDNKINEKSLLNIATLTAMCTCPLCKIVHVPP